MPCAIEIQPFAVPASRPTLVASYFAPTSERQSRMKVLAGGRDYRQALQPFLDRAGRGADSFDGAEGCRSVDILLRGELTSNE